MIDGFDADVAQGAPSLIDCERLSVQGPWRFEAGVVCEGDVSFVNESGEPRLVAAGTYSGEQFA